VETVDGVWHSKVGLEQCVDLLLVAEIGFSGDDVLSALWCFWLDNVGENELDIWGLGVGEEGLGELESVRSGLGSEVLHKGRRDGTECARERPMKVFMVVHVHRKGWGLRDKVCKTPA
jgi:hypothetical protein